MDILMTSAGAPLAQALAEALQPAHTVRLTERIFVPNLANFAQSALHHDLSTNLLVRGLDAVVHVAEPLPGDSEEQQIDYLTRCTYNLCAAAVAEGVRRVVLLSTLDVMTAYDEQFTVTERWRPKPTAAAPILAKHLAEFTCREFAREHKLDVAVLRLGRVVQADKVVSQPFDPLWVAEADVAQAVERTLTVNTGRWGVFHIGSDAAAARFSVTKAKSGLGYAPVHHFQPG